MLEVSPRAQSVGDAGCVMEAEMGKLLELPLFVTCNAVVYT